MNATPDFSAWVGRTELVSDDLSPGPATAAAATFDDERTPVNAGAALPLLWHWFYFLVRAPQSRLSADGHPQRGDFLPPIPYPRRMFAGARLQVHQPLVLGTPARREGVIRNITLKSGRSGALAFVTVGYNFWQHDTLCIEEEQDIVYREPGSAVPAPIPTEWPAPPEGAWSTIVAADSRLLFRFSALTFNAHRIHYDRPYAIEEEGYPGLVVHGPLTAILLLDLVRRHSDRPVRAFSFRGLAPLFDLAPFRLVGLPEADRVTLEAQGPDSRTALQALAEF
jgi:3-methylfumaryl-CoA hydratase